uniref:DNA-directed RNA polymerase n=1 Tax=Silene vulgaris TaxID=42043 RepID=J7FAC1_SILVU|nr:RNA polymerase [Silene vulgaris]
MINAFQEIPITQDASASAYQIMAYFLLDETMAMKTNLIINKFDWIVDIYEMFKEECLEYIHKNESDKHFCQTLSRVFTRKIVKNIFMPIIYGKTVNSTGKDLHILLGNDLLKPECFKLAKLCYAFWHDTYNHMYSFIDLIGLVGRVCASLERPVLFNTKFYDTHQDYKKVESCSVRVFDKINRKNRTVNLSVPSDVRDKRKSRAATFVNFIHQRDAKIAMSVAEIAGSYQIPLYTVHDNFISNTINSQKLPNIYCHVFREMEAPMTIINRFIYNNLIKPSLDLNDSQNKEYMEHLLNHRIDRQDLESILKKDIPMSEMKNKKGWDKIIKNLLDQYDLYCIRVGVLDMSLDNHKNLWNTLRSKINGLYSVHN